MSSSILIISKESDETTALCEVLRLSLGYEVLQEKTGEEAIRVIREYQSMPLMVMLSLSLKDMTSHSLMHLLHQVNPVMPIVTLAESGQEQAALELISNGAVDFVHMPASLPRLKATVENALYIRALRETVQWLEAGKHPNLSRGNSSPKEASPTLIGMRPPPLNILNSEGDVKPLMHLEEEIIKKALTYHHGQVSLVARQLRIGRSTLYRKMEQYELHLDK